LCLFCLSELLAGWTKSTSFECPFCKKAGDKPLKDPLQYRRNITVLEQMVSPGDRATQQKPKCDCPRCSNNSEKFCLTCRRHFCKSCLEDRHEFFFGGSKPGHILIDCDKIAPINAPPAPKDNPWKKKMDEEERKRKEEDDRRKRAIEEEDRRRRAASEERRRKAAEEEERKKREEASANRKVPSFRGVKTEEPPAPAAGKKTFRKSITIPKPEPPPEPEPEPDALPPGWTEVTDKKTGKTYYYNKNTKKTSWKRPEPEEEDIPEPEPEPEEDELPPGWTEVTDKKTGKTYYYNKNTKKTSWKRPEPEEEIPEPEEEEAPEPEEDELPPGWTEVTDKKTGKTYYYNKNTKKTSWKRPEPEPEEEEIPEPEEEDDLPPGWTEVTDKKTGKTYYYNKNTKKTTWKRPTA